MPQPLEPGAESPSADWPGQTADRHRVEAGPVSHPLERLRGLGSEQLLVFGGGSGAKRASRSTDRGSGGLPEHREAHGGGYGAEQPRIAVARVADRLEPGCGNEGLGLRAANGGAAVGGAAEPPPGWRPLREAPTRAPAGMSKVLGLVVLRRWAVAPMAPVAVLRGRSCAFSAA